MLDRHSDLFKEYLDKMLSVFNFNVLNTAGSHDLSDVRKAFGNYEFCLVAREAFELLIQDESAFIETYLEKKVDKNE